MKKFYFVFFFLLVLLSINLVAADKIQVSNPNVGLTIEYQKYDYLKIGQPFQVNAHVFNTSTGLPVNNDSVDCFFHGYYANGTHAARAKMDFNPPFDFYLDLPGEFFTGGKGSFIIQCNNSEGGFASGRVLVTGSGLPMLDSEAKFYYAMLFAIFLFFVLFLIIFLKAPYENEKELTKEGWAITKVTKGKYVKIISLWIAYGFFLLFMTTISGMANNYIMFEGLRITITRLWFFLSVVGKGLNWAMGVLLIVMTWKDILLNKVILREGRKLLN